MISVVVDGGVVLLLSLFTRFHSLFLNVRLGRNGHMPAKHKGCACYQSIVFIQHHILAVPLMQKVILQHVNWCKATVITLRLG